MDGNVIWLNECSKFDFSPKIMKYPMGTRTSQDAANQLGCDVSHIAKSIVFRGEEGAIVVITSGSNKVDRKGKLKRLLGYKPSMADSSYVNYDLIWGAAGTSDTVFPIKPKKLLTMSGAKLGDIKL
jgi:prolyl-tRNA editing enzyme YbaK/EbsC (Cys-tRNA(Pro) deacylase)